MAKMKAAVCVEPQKIEIKDVDVPQPKEYEVLVQVKATGLCGSDVDGYLNRHPMIGYPIILGHECSGIISEVGPGVENVSVGDEVIVEPFFTCKKCAACKQGRYNLCKDLLIIGHQINGSMADYCLAEAGFVHPKPANISWGEAAIAEPLSGALHAVERCNLHAGDIVVIIGCGTIGSFALQHARNKAARVLACDVKDSKVRLANVLGATWAINRSLVDLKDKVMEITGGVGADCVIEAVGLPETLAETVGLVRRGGTIMLIGWSGNEADAFDLTSVTLDELTVLGTLGFCWDFQRTIALAEMGLVDLKSVITHHFPLEDVEKAIKMMHDGKDDVGKVIIES